MAGRVVIQYKAAQEWDGRVMEIVVENPPADWLDHWEWYRDEGRGQCGRASKVWVPNGSYAGQEAREWYLRNDQVQSVEVERPAVAEAVEQSQGDLFEDADGS